MKAHVIDQFSAQAHQFYVEYITLVLQELGLSFHDEVLSIEFKKFSDPKVAGITKGNHRYPSVVEISTDAILHNSMDTIAHELIHIKQQVKGELVARGSGAFPDDYVEWKGKRVPSTLVHMMRLIDDRLQPWEAEAYSLSRPLAKAAYDRLSPTHKDFYQDHMVTRLSDL